MPNFDYVYYDKMGKQKKGTMEALSEEKVSQILRGEGLIPISVREQNILNKDINFSFGSPVKTKDLCVFCRQFESIMRAGVNLSEALQLLGDDTENKAMAAAIKAVYTSVQKGDTMADAMRQQNKIFPEILINMVESGEASGNLDTAFGRMADQFEKEAKLQATVKKAMVYPIIVLAISVVVVVVMMMFVIPNFSDMLAQAGTELPAVTKLVMSVSDFLLHNFILLTICIAAVIAAFIFYKGTDHGKHVLGTIALKLPLFGKLTTKSACARFTRIMSTLLAAGVPLIEAVEICAKVMDNVIIKEALLNAKNDVSRGESLSHSMASSGVFPNMVCNMIKIGEETGNMESMLERIANYYDDEVNNATESLTAVMEPMIIVILAVIVGTIMFAVLMPMMSLYGSIENM